MTDRSADDTTTLAIGSSPIPDEGFAGADPPGDVGSSSRR
jgi:hypothetical protein